MTENKTSNPLKYKDKANNRERKSRHLFSRKKEVSDNFEFQIAEDQRQKKNTHKSSSKKESTLSKLNKKIESKLLPFSRDIHRVETPTYSRLLNELSRVAHFKNVEHKDGILIFQAPSKERDEIIALINNLCYNHTILGTKGILNALYSVLKRTGLVVGLFCAVCVFAVYPHFVFTVDYEGEADRKVKEVLNAYGIVSGRFVTDFNGQQIEEELFSIEGISFASVRKIGTRVYVRVVHEQSADGYVDMGAGAIVAEKDGVVTRMIVYSGTAEVAVGDRVSKGQILIGEYYLKGEDKIPATASGIVYGERTVTYTRFFPDTVLTESGRQRKKTVVGVFREAKTPSSPYESYTVTKTVTKNDFLIPFVVYTWTFFELCPATNTMSEEQMRAVAYGEVLDKNQFERVLSHSAEGVRVDGGYEVKVTLTVEEKL